MNDIISMSFLFPNEISGVINTIIFFLLFLTIIVSWITIRRYRITESEALRIVQSRVNEKLSTLNSPDLSQNQDMSEKCEENGGKKNRKDENSAPDLLMEIEELCELRESIDKDSIIYKRIDAIERMRNYWVKIDVDFLQQAAITAESSRLGITLPKFSTNLALILGLFGTFIGLALMVTEISMLMPNPSATDFSISTLMSSISGMETVFSGIKTAFSRGRQVNPKSS